MRLLKVGRQGCDITLYSDKVSSLHAEITLLDSGDILLEDKGSRNGTFIMNQPIAPNKPVSIKRGDAIRFADVELQWSQVPMPEDNSAYKAIFGIGSNFQNDIQISGGTVSRYHATVKLGRDGKMYIVDHSKNGTTVDGRKIQPNNPYRIKKKNAVVCGGVPVDLSRLPWPSEAWKKIGSIAAMIAVLVGLTFGTYKLIGNGKVSDTELFNRYNHSVVMLKGIYHYEVSIGDGALPVKEYNNLMMSVGLVNCVFPEKLLPTGKSFIDVSEFTQSDLISALNKDGIYGGTGFFISEDGKLLTNLHIVKPWLYDDATQKLQDLFSEKYAVAVERLNSILQVTSLSQYLSRVKVKGVLDYIALIPQGEIFDEENIIKCKVLSAGEDVNKDVALIQTVSKRLPTSDCTFIDVDKCLDTSEEVILVGKHIYTLGFPRVNDGFIQREGNESGIQAVGQDGKITQQNLDYDFGHNASTTGGASGSPIFNEYGRLIGVHHAGLSRVETQGYNYGVKAKFVRELLDNPHNK